MVEQVPDKELSDIERIILLFLFIQQVCIILIIKL